MTRSAADRAPALAAAALMALTAANLSTAAAPNEIARSVIPNGGGRSAGGRFEITGTAGQRAIGVSRGGSLRVSGGFWFGDPNGPCNPADFEPAFGVLDVNDVLTFVMAFEGGQPRADLFVTPGEPTLDINDILAFAAAFNAGCP